MEDRQQWLSIAAVVLVIGGLGYFLYQRSRQEVPVNNLGEGIEIEEKANQLLESMNIDVPEGADRANLKDVNGGDNTGVATRSFENGEFTHSVVAALPDPEKGSFYQGWLTNEAGESMSTGKLRIAKGGFILDFTSNKDLSDYSKVMITLEKVDDNKPEESLLEGSFYFFEPIGSSTFDREYSIKAPALKLEPFFVEKIPPEGVAICSRG